MKLSFDSDEKAEEILKHIEKFQYLPKEIRAVPIIEAKMIVA